ncbi:MAG: class I tRNA ligase family protein, partial [Candidatus Aminicenantes bacterium]
QWFIKILDFKQELLAQGAKIKWHPAHMQTRYEHWVMGLNQEWCISRQRYFGVPLPVWYPVLDSGQPDYKSPIFPVKKNLPVDPLIDVPPGYSPEQRDQPGGFIGEEDVMDTWATSSLTPQISSHWGINDRRHKKLFPTDLRPQAHDIIRTWAFYTIVKAWMHDKEIPWKHAAISGFILDPDRKKMSKSKGNVMTPEYLLNQHSSDVFRYWASRGRLGVDSAFDETPFKIGRKLVIKIFNASKFVLMQLDRAKTPVENFSLDQVCTECDRAWVAILKKTIDSAAAAFEDYDYTTALQQIEDTFWYFCDHYLEMVKTKAYQGGETPGSQSALVTLNWSLKTFLRLFAPFMPFLTEEIWSWRYTGESASIHKASWPTNEEVAAVEMPAHDESFACAVEVISRIRGFKTENKVSQKRPVKTLEIRSSQANLDAVRPMIPYIVEAANAEASPVLTIDDTIKEEEGRFKVSVQLGEYKA